MLKYILNSFYSFFSHFQKHRLISNLEGDRKEAQWQIQLYKNKIREIQERQLPKIEREQEDANVELRMPLKESQK